MKPDWVRLCRARDLKAEPPCIRVAFSEGRGHRVEVVDDGDAFGLTAVVVGKAIATAHASLSLRAWLLNRRSSLVGFRVDGQGRLLAEAWIPKAGVTAAEFQLYVRAVGAESDRLEYTITGEDRE